MVYELSQNYFVNLFDEYGRGNQFSQEARRALFDYLEEFGDDYRCDIIGLCCSYCEVDSIGDFNATNDTEYTSLDDIDQTDHDDIIAFVRDWRGNIISVLCTY